MGTNFSFEKTLWSRGYKLVAGADEVGRGSFAGPVVAAAVVFDSMINAKLQMLNGILIDDSKKLTARQRERAEDWIKKNAVAWGIGEGSVSLINRMGMGKATKIAFRRAIKNVNAKLQISNAKLDFLLIDAFYIPYVKGLRRKSQKAIINGDEKSITIAAASIIAKVYRDKLMTDLSKRSEFKKYGWKSNKGYGTKQHRLAISEYGITKLHRRVFFQTFLKNSKNPRIQNSKQAKN